jgi:signal recognition particle receptor subunit beta
MGLANRLGLRVSGGGWLLTILTETASEMSFLHSILSHQATLPALTFLCVVLVLLWICHYLDTYHPIGGNYKKLLIVGPCGSGKTVMFHQLVNGEAPPLGSVASMQHNEGICHQVKSLKVIDIPGHERLKKLRDEQLKDCGAVLFVVDSCVVEPQRTEAAEDLFEVLTHPNVAKKKLPIMIACNKSDLENNSHSLDFCRRTLDRQLDAMRKTRATLSPEAAVRAALLGKGDLPFSLSGLKNAITFCPSSALNRNIDDIWVWLKTNFE